jgi:hypothetical protein
MGPIYLINIGPFSHKIPSKGRLSDRYESHKIYYIVKQKVKLMNDTHPVTISNISLLVANWFRPFGALSRRYEMSRIRPLDQKKWDFCPTRGKSKEEIR